MRPRYVLFTRIADYPNATSFHRFEGDTVTVQVIGDAVKIELFDKGGVLVKACHAVPEVYHGEDLDETTLCAILYDRQKFDTFMYPATY